MPLNIPDKLKLDLASLEQDTMLELYEIDLTNLTNRNGQRGQIIRLHNGMNEVKQNVVWLGNEYQAYPIQGSDFESKAQGASNRPKLAISNLFGLVTGMVNDFGDCLGAKVTRTRIYAKYLDPVNFVGGQNPQHDKNMKVSSIYYIEQMTSQSAESATFTLVIPTEFDNIMLPARMMMSNTCSWVYRSAECGYTGGAVADEKDQPTTDIKKDKCSKCRTGCKLRNNIRNFGAFIAINHL